VLLDRHPGLDPGSIFFLQSLVLKEKDGCRIKSGMTKQATSGCGRFSVVP
jgi:hypothetical protein